MSFLCFLGVTACASTTVDLLIIIIASNGNILLYFSIVHMQAKKGKCFKVKDKIQKWVTVFQIDLK